MTEVKHKASCIILAGGEGRRMGGQDKGLVLYKGNTLIQHVIDRVESQVDEIVISANRNVETYKSYGHAVISDAAEQYQGPLAGMSAALPQCNNEWVFITPCDMPLLPLGIVAELFAYIEDKKLCVATVEDRMQLTMLVHKSLQSSIFQSLQHEQLRLMSWVKAQDPAVHAFSDRSDFKNFNDSNDLISESK